MHTARSAAAVRRPSPRASAAPPGAGPAIGTATTTTTATLPFPLARTAAAALLAAVHLASACASPAAPLPSASPPDAVVRRLPPLPPAPPPLLAAPASSAAADAASTTPTTTTTTPPLLGPTVLPNGLRLFLLEDHEAPLIRGTLLVRGGARAVPDEKLGLGAITAAAQRTGGSRKTPAPHLDDALADLAADIEVSAGPLAFAFDFGCLSADAPRVLGLVAELAREPAFPDDRVSAARRQVVDALEHADDDAGSVARRRLLELLYGQGSVYARRPTAGTAGSVTREDVVALARRWQRPDAALLGIAGDFDAAEMRDLVERTFGGWRPAQGQPKEPPVPRTSRPPELPSAAALLALAGGVDASGAAAPPPSAASTQQQQQQQQQQEQQQEQEQRPLVLLLDRPGLAQATVVVGEPGVSVSDPDAPSLDVLSTALNSFGGALFDAVRSRDGLAYSVSASWDTPSDHRGLFAASADTSRPAELLVELRRALQRAAAAQGGVSDSAVARAVDQSLEQYAFSLGGSGGRMARALSYDALGLPQDFAARYRDRLAAVSPESVAAAARRWLHPSSADGQVVVVAADAKVALPDLEAAGFRVALLPSES